MPSYTYALLLTVEAEDFETGLESAKQIADGVGQEGINISVITNYDKDNYGNRVVYLLPENISNERDLARIKKYKK